MFYYAEKTSDGSGVWAKHMVQHAAPEKKNLPLNNVKDSLN